MDVHLMLLESPGYEFFVSPTYTFPQLQSILYTPGWLWDGSLILWLQTKSLMLAEDEKTVFSPCFRNALRSLGPRTGIHGILIVFDRCLLSLFRCFTVYDCAICSSDCRSWPFSTKTSTRNLVSLSMYCSEQIRLARAKKPLNTPSTIRGLILEWGLICTFVIASLRWTLNWYFPEPSLITVISRNES